MSFKIRNTIILASVWVVITGAGLAYWQFWQPRQVKSLKKDIEKVDRELNDLPGLTDEVQRLTLQYQDVKKRYDSRSKEIPSYDMSSQTYGYISNGIDEAGFVKFDMKFLGTADQPSWGYNAYRLDQGEAQFANLYRFVYYLENGRRLYKIATMIMDLRESVDSDTKETIQTVAFELELHAYYVKNVPELNTSLAAKSLTMIPAPTDPFKPLILQTLSVEAPSGEVNADKAEVKAVLPGKVFLQVDNEMVILHLGDKVWRGYVSRIDPQDSAVEFVLDEGGVTRTLVKKIQFERKLNKKR